jgi:hypothetical protein
VDILHEYVGLGEVHVAVGQLLASPDEFQICGHIEPSRTECRVFRSTFSYQERKYVRALSALMRAPESRHSPTRMLDSCRSEPRSAGSLGHTSPCQRAFYASRAPLSNSSVYTVILAFLASRAASWSSISQV